MNTAQLTESIRAKKGTEIATIETETIPRLNKAGKSIFGDVVKKSTMNVMIGFDYENRVNNQLEREDAERDFKSAPRRWGNRVDLKTVEHKGETYLTINSLKVFDVSYIGEDGETIEPDAIKPFLPKKSPSRQGTTKEIIYRDFKATNIKAINFRGTREVITF